MKIWLDDMRPSPEGWTQTKTAWETIKLLQDHNVEIISLDHDLGDEPVAGTGYDVLLWIEDHVFLSNYQPPEIELHTSNSPAAERMAQAMASIKRIISQRGE